MKILSLSSESLSICHKAYHAGKIVLKQKRVQSFRDAAFMGNMRRTFFCRLKAQHPEIEVLNTCGCITKNNRIQHGIKKTHHASRRLCVILSSVCRV